MKVAFGLKAHSGWAALVVVGRGDGEFVIVDRRRIELVEETWAKQPYHAAEELNPIDARRVVRKGINSAKRIARREMLIATRRERRRQNEVIGCAVLVTDPMPNWSVDEILAVHFRMHKAEGVLFREVLSSGAKAANIELIEVHEKSLIANGCKALKKSEAELTKMIASLGKAIGPPWGKDQKESAVAAMIALQETHIRFVHP